MFNFQQFFDVSYLFSSTPGTLSTQFLYSWLVVAVGLIVATIAVRVWLRQRHTALLPAWRSWWLRASYVPVTTGVGLLVLLFFRYQRAPLLSARYLTILWLLIMAIWLVLVLRARGRVMTAAAEQAEQRRLKKYLP